MKRLKNESYEDYKQRRKDDQKLTKVLLRGRLVWQSLIQSTTDPLKFIGRTYIKAKHGELK